jgi:antitoxin component of MazEF toxin-antitoxin module
MKGKIKRIAEGVLLVSDEPLLDQLGLDDDSEVELSTNGDVLTVTPIRDLEREHLFRQAAEQVLETHAGLFRRLSK